MLDSDGGLLRGTLDLLVLKAVSWGPRHGYAVAEWIHSITDGELLVEEGPLYTALHRLERQGWLLADWGVSENNRRAKYYRLSRSGRAELRGELSRWEQYTRAVAKAIAAPAPTAA
jgi:PadR family transcriptional regulator PadR